MQIINYWENRNCLYLALFMAIVLFGCSKEYSMNEYKEVVQKELSKETSIGTI